MWHIDAFSINSQKTKKSGENYDQHPNLNSEYSKT